ncbi:hypothetical protein [Halorhabdus rudnickae]|uniref:hypothetical protein n=1 Tax=Halorhabdus rudnickae TaxID=1775544 RepID=UPI0010828EEA|nr:hypothetical protein [Halorhabdus rudnickae]
MSQTRTNSRFQFSRGEQLSIGSAVVVVIAAFLPWITASILGTSVTVSGIDGDGVFTLAFAIIAAALVVARPWDRINKIAVGILGGLTAAVALYYIVDPAMGVKGGGAGAELARQALSPGIGLYLTALGGVGLVLGAALETVS